LEIEARVKANKIYIIVEIFPTNKEQWKEYNGKTLLKEYATIL